MYDSQQIADLKFVYQDVLARAQHLRHLGKQPQTEDEEVVKVQRIGRAQRLLVLGV